MKITLTEPLRRFFQEIHPPCVSIYYPTHRQGPETRQDPIRMKNLLRKASDRLAADGFADQSEEMLEPAWDLIPDLDFWTHQQDGLALFASDGHFRYFHLPYPVPEVAVVSRHFYLKPLLPLFSQDDHFHVLAISRNRVQLYEANRYSIRQVDVPGLPESLAEALQFDEGEVQLQQHTSGPIGQAGNTIFHGQGGEKNLRKEELLRYFYVVDRALHRFLRESNLPLVLAGVEHSFPIYHEANTYPFLVKSEGVPGGLESLTEEELHERAWTIARPHVNQGQKRLMERFKRVAYSNGNGGLRAARELEKAVLAAYQGRVDALMIPRDREVWGEFDERKLEVNREGKDPAKRRELLDFAAMQTLLHEGELYLVPEESMPPDAEVAAMLRYGSGIMEEAV